MNVITEIVVKGRLDSSWKTYFKGMAIHANDSTTTLSGKIKDQAQLHGILNQIRDLNIELISVNQFK